MTERERESGTGADERTEPMEAAVDLVGHREQLRGLAVSAAIELGIVDSLDDDPKPAVELAATLELDPGATRRLVRALESYDVVETDDGGGVSLTDVGERFAADHPESVQEFVRFFYHPARLATLEHLPRVVADGDRTGYEFAHGHGLFEHCERDAAFAECFNGMQDLFSRGATEHVIAALDDYDLSGVDTVCDVGGGYGDLLCRVLAANPGLEGYVLELPNVVAREERLWASKLGVADRCEYVAGDMFESVPTADLYLLQSILHDWPDDDCVQILRTIHDDAPADARVLVRERVLPETDPSTESTTPDVWMLLETGGRERTRSEFETLFERAGWTLREVVETDDEHCIVEGVKDEARPRGRR